MRPVPASTPRCSLRHDRRTLVPCLSDSARQDGGKSNWAEVAIGQAALGVLWVVSSGVISPWMVGGRSSAIGSTCM